MKWIIHHATGFLKEQLAEVEAETENELREKVMSLCEAKGWHLSNVWIEDVNVLPQASDSTEPPSDSGSCKGSGGSHE